MATATSPRKYDASRRREAAKANRQLVIEAASRLFLERGWAGTSMRDIASEANLSIETVYGSGGPKLELLKIAMDIAVVGDDAPVPLTERPQWQAILVGDSAHDRALAVGELLVHLLRRTAPLRRALTHAAAGDPALGQLLQDDYADMREQHRQAIAAVARREPTPQELDLVMAALSNETYLTLTEQRRLTDADYREFVATAITRLMGLEEENQP